MAGKIQAWREDVLFLLWEDNGAHLSDRVMSSVRGECVIFFPPPVHSEDASAVIDTEVTQLWS